MGATVHVHRVVGMASSILSIFMLPAVGWGGAYSGGDGLTEATAYRISNISDWAEFMGATEDWTGHYFILTADLDLSGWVFSDAVIAPDSDNLTNGFQGVEFTSVFDGGGHVISGFTIEGGGNDYMGLFGYLGNGGQIKNLGVVDANIQGRYCVGGLVGSIWLDGEVSACYTTSCVIGEDSKCGGLAGQNYGTITACCATGSVSGNGNVGGLVGWNVNTINSCYATGSVNGIYFVGGLVGLNDGTASSCYATGTVSGQGAIGGLVGGNYYTIHSCHATGSVNGTGSSIGGLAGENSYTGAIHSSYATGTVDGDIRVGGLAGFNRGKVIHCYSTGRPSGTGNVGGLCGGIDIVGDYYEDTGNFWDIEASETINSWMGMGKTTEQMQTLSTFIDAGWDFVTEWSMPYEGYPRSKWAKYSGGNGLSEATAYRISNTSDWMEFMGATGDWTGMYFILTADIDLTGWVFGEAVIAPDIDNWTPDLQGIAFTSVFDGGGHVISGFTIEGGGNDYIGLFGYLGSGGQIKNLGVVNADIQGRYYVGGLAGYNDSGTIISSYTTGDISGEGFVGGLVGDNLGAISYCHTEGAISGTVDYIGGLTGRNYNGTIHNCYATGITNGFGRVGGLVGLNVGTLSFCHTTGIVNGTGSDVGGLVGDNYGEITSCYATGNVNGAGSCVGGLVGVNSYSGEIYWSHATGAVIGQNCVGGLVGFNSFGEIGWCYATGSVEGEDKVGGLVGIAHYCTISYCYARGNVSGTGNEVGGLAGSNSGAINSCYATGTAEGEDKVGGLVGYNYQGQVIHCYSTGRPMGTGSVGGLCGRD